MIVLSCQPSTEFKSNFNPSLSIRMSKRFFDCSLADGKREFAPFVPQVVSRARATPDVGTMSTVHQFQPEFKWIWYSASELKTIERCVS